MSLGILGSMMQGAGKGITKNAQDSIDKKERIRQEEAEDAKYQARLKEQRDYAEAQYAQRREDELADAETERQHQIALQQEKNSVLGGMGGESPAIKAAKKDYIDTGNYYLSKIKEINESHLDEGEKEQRLLLTLGQFQNFMDNTRGMSQYTTMSNVFSDELAMWQDHFMPQGGQGEPSNPSGQPASATTKKPPTYNPSATTGDSSPASTQTRAEKEQAYLSRSPEWQKKVAGSVGEAFDYLNNLNQNRHSERAVDLEQLHKQGGVRPF